MCPTELPPQTHALGEPSKPSREPKQPWHERLRQPQDISHSLFSSLCFSLCIQMVYRLTPLVFSSCCLITGHKEGNSFLYCVFSVSCFRLLEERGLLCSIPKRLIGCVCACIHVSLHTQTPSAVPPPSRSHFLTCLLFLPSYFLYLLVAPSIPSPYPRAPLSILSFFLLSLSLSPSIRT